MDNREKLIAIGEKVFGKQWQSPMSRLLGVDSRAVRRYVSGDSRPPMTYRLIEALEKKQREINEAIALAQSDLISGDDATIEVIDSIVSQYTYEDEHYRKGAFDAVNNSIYEETYLSDLHQAAKKYAQE
ncbi:hypothetical protein PSI23_11010 [Xenorhabdus sp. XENO-10]|uniref:Transcriptional regulator n=1 Tax=Xenorhabdus yunnanensis TaxID=3025878 RepID=A0ABT5LFC2_9GAMM|nr:hypothetical protein [Xenorhabdus yunnanensis]MDC9589812.1 hypothetical protein [Xenorhabdus yunnanensis]